jgi:hypothetical protein
MRLSISATGNMVMSRELDWVIDWGFFASLVAQPRRTRIANKEDEDDAEDIALY